MQKAIGQAILPIALPALTSAEAGISAQIRNTETLAIRRVRQELLDQISVWVALVWTQRDIGSCEGRIVLYEVHGAQVFEIEVAAAVVDE